MDELTTRNLKDSVKFEPIDAETWIDIQSTDYNHGTRGKACRLCGYMTITTVTFAGLMLLCLYTWFSSGGPTVGTIDEWSSVLERKLEGSDITTISGK